MYAITPKGGAALRSWLAEPGAGPSLEFEALLKVFLADHGSKEALLTNIRAIRQWAEDEHRRGSQLGREYLATGGPFPDRLHLIALLVRFLGFEGTAAVPRWAAWAEHEVTQWPHTRGVDPDRRVFEDYLKLCERQLAQSDSGDLREASGG